MQTSKELRKKRKIFSLFTRNAYSSIVLSSFARERYRQLDPAEKAIALQELGGMDFSGGPAAKRRAALPRLPRAARGRLPALAAAFSGNPARCSEEAERHGLLGTL